MKPGLQRIEATLTQLDGSTGSGALEHEPVEPLVLVKPSNSLVSQALQPVDRTLVETVHASVATSDAAEASCSFAIAPVKSSVAPPEPAPAPIETAALHLPRLKPTRFTHHRHAPNPALSLGLLREIETIVLKWQRELHQTARTIHQLYQEGPIVNGWLESQPYPNATEEHTPLSHVELNHLLDVIQELLNTTTPQIVTHDSPRAGYRLCWLDPDGQVQCRPCPPEKVPPVSLAIARSQKLRQLLARQQYLEGRLNQLAQTLVGVHSSLQE